MGEQITFRVERYNRVSSTNDICMKGAGEGATEGLVVAARFQEQGRGQRGNSWESEEGLNLTFSILLRPSFLRVENQFLLSKMASVAICDWLTGKADRVAVKWPNDIYIGNCKAAGILIENSFCSSFIEVSVVGIGLNLNQRQFSSDLPNPTSVALSTGKDYQPDEALEELIECISARYCQLKEGDTDLLSNDYFNLLYRKDTYCLYRGKEGDFLAKIHGIKPSGELILETDAGELKAFGFKEVLFII